MNKKELSIERRLKFLEREGFPHAIAFCNRASGRDGIPVQRVVAKKKKKREELGPSRNIDFMDCKRSYEVLSTRYALQLSERPSDLADIFTRISDLSGVSFSPPQPRRFKSRQTFWWSSKDSSHESSLSYRYCRPLRSSSYILVSSWVVTLVSFTGFPFVRFGNFKRAARFLPVSLRQKSDQKSWPFASF